MVMRFTQRSVALVLACLVGTLASCGPSELADAPDSGTATTAEPAPDADNPDESVSAEQPTAAKTPAQQSTAGARALPPGRYCYQLETDTLTENIRLTVQAGDRLTGDAQGTIHNEAEGYYSSYIQKLTGTLKGDQANLKVTTWIEYDVQDSSETWTVTANTLNTDRETLTTADCAVVSQAFQGPDGLEASDLLADATAVNTERVQFKPGSRSTSISHSVLRGERDVYVLGAEGGQRMDLAITSLEENAVLDVVDPSGLVLAREATQEQLILPHTGDYQVIVGGTRGNATYDLTIGIE
jgi:hypothetical protein